MSAIFERETVKTLERIADALEDIAECLKANQ